MVGGCHVVNIACMCIKLTEVQLLPCLLLMPSATSPCKPAQYSLHSNCVPHRKWIEGANQLLNRMHPVWLHRLGSCPAGSLFWSLALSLSCSLPLFAPSVSFSLPLACHLIFFPLKKLDTGDMNFSPFFPFYPNILLGSDLRYKVFVGSSLVVWLHCRGAWLIR